MCLYSVEVVTSRRPSKGEVLRVRAIGDGVGFVGEDGEVVCLRQGTELEFAKRVRTTCAKRDEPSCVVAKFRYLRAKRTSGLTYDALDFADGRQLMVVWLKPRQTVRVLQLPVQRKRRKPAAAVRQPARVYA